MKTETIFVDNLKCHGCAKTIRRELAWIGEVIEVDVNVDESLVKIDYTGKNKMREIFAGQWTSSADRIEQELDFQFPYSLQDRLDQAAQWYLENEWL